MAYLMLFIFCFLGTGLDAGAQIQIRPSQYKKINDYKNDPEQEEIYYRYLKMFKGRQWTAIISPTGEIAQHIVPSILMDAAWDYTQEQLEKKQWLDKYGRTPLQTLIERLRTAPKMKEWPLSERLRLELLELKSGMREALNQELQAELKMPLLEAGPNGLPEGFSLKAIFQVLQDRQELAKNPEHKELVDILEKSNGPALSIFRDAVAPAMAISESAIKDLFDHQPQLENFANGRYQDGVRLFLFCRHNREFPCLMVMKDAQGRPILEEDGVTPWAQPALAAANRGRSFMERNGPTPTGVYTIDGVMPETNRKRYFGRFRRVVLNFLNDVESTIPIKAIKEILPESSFPLPWWKQSIVAQILGRNLLRIHGTGKRARFPGSPYYPFVKTEGCISKLEGRYNGKVYKGQRDLLDKLMEGLGLTPRPSYEERIKGLLYVVEINDEEKAVTLEDLKFLFNNEGPSKDESSPRA